MESHENFQFTIKNRPWLGGVWMVDKLLYMRNFHFSLFGSYVDLDVRAINYELE